MPLQKGFHETKTRSLLRTPTSGDTALAKSPRGTAARRRMRPANLNEFVGNKKSWP